MNNSPGGLTKAVLDEIALEGLDGVTIESKQQQKKHRIHQKFISNQCLRSMDTPVVTSKTASATK